MTTDSRAPDTVRTSGCYVVNGGVLTGLRPAGGTTDRLANLVHGQLRALLLNDAYPCLGGTSAVRTGQYRFGVYPALGSRSAVEDCTEDLRSFLAATPADSHPVAVHLAVFDGPVSADEHGFEQCLWRQLQAMHRLDAARPEAPEPPPIVVEEADEGFPFLDRTFFVVGLHPAASRWARRFGWPTLAFNALTHDALLRRRGQYERMQHIIRRRDTRLQGAPNPAVDRPQVAQFAGRLVGPEWQCPAEVQPS